MSSTTENLKKISIQLLVNDYPLLMEGMIDAQAAKTLKQLYIEQVVDNDGSVEAFGEMIKKEHPEIIAELDKIRDKFIREYLRENSMEEGFIGPFRIETDFDGFTFQDRVDGDYELGYDFTDVSEYIED